MLVKMFTMRDRKSAMYGNPFVSHNEQTAKRDFNAFCRLPENQYLSGDMELYSLGTFDSDTGELISYKPEFICGGEVIE